MKALIYLLLRAYVWLGLHIYFSRLRVVGRENIPKSGAVIFTANHQNAFLDALLVVTNNGRKTHFVARAEVFKKPLFRWLLSLINMMPIYRMRDGWQSLQQNEAIFKACFGILGKKQTLLIFPEGNHGFERRLRPLSKGFTRIAFGSLAERPDLDLKIVPVGINYHRHQAFRSRVSIYYGKPVLVHAFYNPDDEHLASLELRNEIAGAMKPLITHIESDDYQQAFEKLMATQPDLSDPVESNTRIQYPEREYPAFREKNPFGFLSPVFRLNAILPLLIWWQIRGQIKDPVMLASVKFAVGIFVFPLIFLLQSLIPAYLSKWEWGVAYFLFSIITAPLIRR